MSALLEVSDLSISFGPADRRQIAVHGASFCVQEGRTTCIVGESGCGKSVTALALMGLLPARAAHVEHGSIRFEGRELLTVSPAERRALRGNRMAMIFQEPMTSLNPALTIGFQIAEGLVCHRDMSREAARQRTIELLARVRIPDAERRFDEYPHRLSGGMRQRVMIAMALACSPKLLIADEPTTALDVTVQAQILALLEDLRAEYAMATLLITHDLGVVAEVADDVLVMYAGHIVESAPAAALLSEPHHPYTIGLLGAIPDLDAPIARLASIDGQVPTPGTTVKGCAFAARCPFAIGLCAEEMPLLRPIDATPRRVACHRAPLPFTWATDASAGASAAVLA